MGERPAFLPTSIPVVPSRVTPRLRERLELLRALRPSWAIDIRMVRGEAQIECLVWARPLNEKPLWHELTAIRHVTFPTLEGSHICRTALEWVDLEIERVQTPNVPPAHA